MNSHSRLILVWALALSTAIKLALAWSTLGTNDVKTWMLFADSIQQHGGAWLYHHASFFNHPPFMVHALSALTWFVSATGLRFEFLLRLAGILADVGTVLLLARMVKLSPLSALLLAASPAAIFISGFHGNTDPVMIFFVVLAVYLLQSRDSMLLGGLAFGMALNIKIVPVILFPLFFLWAGTAGRRARFVSAAAAAFIAGSVPLLFHEYRVILQNVVGYGSLPGIWGITRIAKFIDQSSGGGILFPTSLNVLRLSFPITMILLALALWQRRVELFESVAVSMFCFLFITPGFGVQYLAWLVPLAVVFRERLHLMFAASSGVFLFAVYNRWAGGMPWYYADSGNVGTWEGWITIAALVCWMSVVLCFGDAVFVDINNRPMPEPRRRRSTAGIPALPEIGSKS